MAAPAPAPAVALHLLPALPDETLEEIFLRLPTPASLAAASAACTTFRRIVAERSFLRRYRKRHPPPLLGLVDDRGDFMPAEAPHPSAPLAEALVAAADFTYSFVPKPTGDTSWYARDVRDGRVLLESSSLLRRTRSIRTTSYAVCDPLSRRYVLLLPIPEDMTVQQQERLAEFEPNLAPAGEDDDDEDETCFKVICTARYKTKLVAFVFPSVTGQWRVGASFSWDFLGTLGPSLRTLHLFNYYSSGCFCWTSCCMGKLLVLNTHKMEFSLVSHGMRLDEQLPGMSTCMPSIFAGTEEAFQIFSLVGHLTSIPTTFYLYRAAAAQQNNGESSTERRLKYVATLPRGYFYFNGGAAEGILFLHGKAWDNNLDRPIGDLTAQDFFSLEVKTLELKKVCRGKPCGVPSGRVHSYFGFPPSLSKPSL
uniref:Uncharacterized protein n=1 Tax=Avena sativa TaxID=4498 RepID=A0ACD5ZH01_AVESA